MGMTAVRHTPPGGLDWSKHALFLDFDGTLAPLADHPGDVRLPARIVPVLHAALAATGGAVAVLSGRALADLDPHLPPRITVRAGSHGAEMTGIHGIDTQPGDLSGPAKPLAALAAAHDLLIEAKPGAVALHYRSRPDLGPLVRRTVDEAVIPGLRALHGNMVSEIARADIDKGTALAALMARPPFAGRVPVMIGDDVTDEDGFRRAQAMGGAGLHIGAGPTVALWRLPTIDAAHDWLARTLTGTPARTEGAAP